MIRTRVRGARRTQARLNKAGAEIGDLRKARLDAAKKVQRSAQREAPKVTGALSRDTQITERDEAARLHLGRLPYGRKVHANNRYIPRATRVSRHQAVGVVRRAVHAIVRRANRR